jgi:ABC-type uncharacterized transport system ATPase subunit
MRLCLVRLTSPNYLSRKGFALTAAAPIVRMENIAKSFGNVNPNDNVSFELMSGEIQGLLGENGAGKTTLMNVLYGLHQPDSDQVIIQGQYRVIRSPHDAIELGIGMVHQHFMQVPTLTVVDNVILGLRNPREPLLDRDGAQQRLEQISLAYGLRVDPHAFIWQLSVGDRQRVEILKALYRNVNVLILDEPTSVLTPQGTEELFGMVHTFVDRGLSVIFITHKPRQ